MSPPGPQTDTGRRVVVTGLGVVSSIGTGVERFWQAALAGAIGTARITQFDTRTLDSDQGGEVTDFDPADYFRRTDPAPLSNSTRFAVAVSRMAMEDAGLLSESRCGVCFGLVMGNRPSVEPVVHQVMRADCVTRQSSSWTDPLQLCRAPADELSLRGPLAAIPTACAAGNSAISYAADLIRKGRAEVMIAGGADQLSPAMYAMFNRFQALSPDLVRPFDKDRKGIIMAEGAAALVLEDAEHAGRRGANVYAEVAGYGNFADAYHMTHPHPDGRGAIRSMQRALDRAGLAAHDVDYISAHGTGTPHNDVTESRAIRTLFGDEADRIPVSSIKSMIGHTQGAACAIEAVACVLSIRDDIIPPTMNLREQDPECRVRVVAEHPLKQPVHTVMNNGFGFGGNISCVVFRKC